MKRKFEIDLLKCITMLMILILHLLSKGGTLYHNENYLNCKVGWLIEAFCIIAVNCYVLVTGYFQVEKEFKWKKVINIWIQTLFYSIIIFLIGLCFGVFDLSLKNILYSCFPVIMNSYWFVTTYLVLYILSPFLNKLIRTLNKNEFRNLIIILVVVFCLWNTFVPFSKTLDETGGYGLIWFIVLYFIGAYEKLYFKQKYKNKNNLICYIGISFTCWIFIFVLSKISNFIGLNGKGAYNFYNYNSITILLSALFFFRYFMNLDLKLNDKVTSIIGEISKLSFAVYLIHEMKLLSNILYNNILKINNIAGTSNFFIIMIIDALIVYVFCIAIEKLRIYIFDKFKINEKIYKFIKKIISILKIEKVKELI